MKPINIKNTMKLYADLLSAERREHKNYKLYHDESRLEKDKAFSEECNRKVLSDKGYLYLCGALAEAQKLARTRTITADRVLFTLTAVEETLDIPKKAMNGITVTIDDNAQHFPNAYKGIPESTRFTAEYKNGWRITDIRRATTRSAYQRVVIEHTDESRAALIKRFTSWG